MAEALSSERERSDLGLPAGEDVPLPVIVEMNLQHRYGMEQPDESGAHNDIFHSEIAWAARSAAKVLE